MPDSIDELVSELRNHPHVYQVRDVSLNETPRVTVQFDAVVLPNVVLDSDTYRVRDVWVGTIPPWYLRRFANEWCLKNGVGSSGIAAELEVDA